jgi:pimeloyl-ACP methyl ester carboxylesterase
VATTAWERLRPQSATPYVELCPLESFPAAPATYVVCAEDRLVAPDWSRRIARERLNAELLELPGGHSPFLSRPGQLAQLLNRIA